MLQRRQIRTMSIAGDRDHPSTEMSGGNHQSAGGYPSTSRWGWKWGAEEDWTWTWRGHERSTSGSAEAETKTTFHGVGTVMDTSECSSESEVESVPGRPLIMRWIFSLLRVYIQNERKISNQVSRFHNSASSDHWQFFLKNPFRDARSEMKYILFDSICDDMGVDRCLWARAEAIASAVVLLWLFYRYTTFMQSCKQEKEN